MPKILRPVPRDPDVESLQHRLQQLGYGHAMAVTGIFDAPTSTAVYLFQLQHVAPTKLPLRADRVVGPDTWWALDNPSGAAQRSGHELVVSALCLPTRQSFLDALAEEYRRDVFEDPDGSNRGPIVDTYWGPTGLIGKPWCCALQSTLLHRALGRYPIGGKHHTGVQKMYQEALRLGMVVPNPIPGHLFVQLKDDGQGHTGAVAAVGTDGWFATFEGNCGNRFKHGRRHVDDIDAWIDPFGDGQDPVFTADVAAVPQLSGGTR
jgi:hypothetical protein